MKPRPEQGQKCASSRENYPVFRILQELNEPRLLERGTDEDGEPIDIKGEVTLAFTADGDLVVGGIFGEGGESTIYIVDLP